MTEKGGRPWQGAAGANGDVDSKIIPVRADEVGAGYWGDEAQMRRYLYLLYGDRPGFVALGVGTPVLRDGRYGHDPFRQTFFELPGDRLLLLQAARIAVHLQRDVFVTPVLRDKASRKQQDSTGLPGQFVWLDADNWTPVLHAELSTLGLPVHLVDSGGPGCRRHAYVDLGELLPGPELAELAARLALVLGTDVAGSDNKLLRLPGTLNHKARLRGGGPGLVSWCEPIQGTVQPGLEVLEAFLATRVNGAATRTTALRPPATARSTVMSEQADSILPAEVHEQPCKRVWSEVEAIEKAFVVDGRHRALLSGLTRLARLETNRHHGVRGQLADLRSAFMNAVQDSRNGPHEAGLEFDRALSGTSLAQPLVLDEYALCSCDLEVYRRRLDDGSLFTGRGRRTERRVMQSLLREAERQHSRRVSKSTRAIAEDAECARRTVTVTLRRLRQLGLIEDQIGRGRAMTTVVLATTSKSDPISVPAAAGKEIGSLPRVGPTHPVFGSQGLRGKQELTFDALDEYRERHGRISLLAVRNGHGLRVRRRRQWRDVSPPSGAGGQTPQQIATRTGTPVATVRQHLRQMLTLQLVFRKDGKWFRLTWDPDLVAQEQGIADVPADRKERHRQEQQRWWDQRARLPRDHRYHVVKQNLDGDTVYLNPKTGEVLWRSRRRSFS